MNQNLAEARDLIEEYTNLLGHTFNSRAIGTLKGDRLKAVISKLKDAIANEKKLTDINLGIEYPEDTLI